MSVQKVNRHKVIDEDSKVMVKLRQNLLSAEDDMSCSRVSNLSGISK